MKKIIIAAIFFTFICLYLLTIKGAIGNPKPQDFKNKLDQIGQPFELSPERSRYVLTMSLEKRGSFSLDKNLGQAAFPDVGVYKGKFFILFAPGVSILILPFYILGSNLNLAQLSTFSAISLFSLFNLIILYRIGVKILKIGFAESLFGAMTFGFISTAWSYSVTLYQHQITVFTILAIFYLSWKFSKSSSRYFRPFYSLVIFSLYGLSIWVDFPNVLFALPVVILHISRLFKFKFEGGNGKIKFSLIELGTISAFILLIALLGLHNLNNYGSPFRVSQSITNYKRFTEGTVKNENSGQSVAGFFQEDRIVHGLYSLIFSLDRGIIIYSPVFVFGILGLYKIIKDDKETGFVLATIAITNLVLYSSFKGPEGGWAFGPRYLIITMAVLSLGVARFISSKNHQLTKKFLVFLFSSYSLGVSLLGVLTTSAIPPKVEADYLKTGYNFLQNLQFLLNGKSSSFVYNTYLKNIITLQEYYIYIYLLTLFLMILTLFIIPRFKTYDD